MIRVVQGDLLAQEADCIVNPANGFLRHGAGLARLIADRAAPKNVPAGPTGDAREGMKCDETGRLWWAEQYGHPTIATGDVAVTSAGHLPYKGIIHAVGPVWKDGTLYERELLAAVHVRAFEAAKERGWKSIAFPAISCGLFRFPVELAAPQALIVANGYRSQFERITFALFEDSHYKAYREAAVRVCAP